MGDDSSRCCTGRALLPILPQDERGTTGATSSPSWRDIFAADPQALDGESPPTLGVSFLRASRHTTTIEYTLAVVRSEGSSKGGTSLGKHATLTLGQDLRKLGLGAVVWDCGEHLAVFLGRNRHLVDGKKVLDLGAGTGVAGLAAAQCGARRTTLTDHRTLGPLVRSNVERNAPGFASTGDCSRPIFVPFSWNNHTPAEAAALAAPNDPFDVVLASDCLYDSAMFAAFRKVLTVTCGPRTILVMAYKRRLDSRERQFFAELEDDFHLEVVDPRHDEPLPTSSKLGDGDTSGGTTADRKPGVYVLLGARRGSRDEKERPSLLKEWDLES